MSPASDSPVRPARARNPRGEGNRLREQLLDATVALLERTGDASQVSLRAITKAAGVSPTAFYLQFESREVAVEAAVDRSFERFNAAIARSAEGEADAARRLRAMGLAYLRFTAEEPSLYRVLFSTRRPIDEDCQPAVDGEIDREQAFVGLVGAVGAALPGSGDDELHLIATMLWSSLHGYATLYASQAWRTWPDPELYVDRLLRGLGVAV